MNANKLADDLDDIDAYEKHQTLLGKSAETLRQQQAEIEELKAGKIRAYDNGVEDGRKPNTHPVKELGYNDIMGTWWEIMPNAKSCEGVFEFARAILRKARE